MTQVSKGNLKLAVSEQVHEPLSSLSRSFDGTQRRWSVIEKEAFPIMKAVNKLRHFLLSDNHFRLFTITGNSIYLFNPSFKKNGLRKRNC